MNVDLNKNINEEKEPYSSCNASKETPYWQWIAAAILIASIYTGYSLVTETRLIAGHLDRIGKQLDNISENVSLLARRHRPCPPGCVRSPDDGRCRNADGLLCE